MTTQAHVDLLFDRWKHLATGIERHPKGTRARAAAIIAANNAWKAWEEADDEVNGNPVGWHRQIARSS